MILLAKKSPPAWRRLSKLNFSRIIHFRQPQVRRYNSRMQATKNLPSSYHAQKTLDLSRARVVFWLNLAAFPLLFLFGWFFNRIITLFRSINPLAKGIWELFATFSVLEVIALALSIILMVVFHELVHGIFFWLFTHQRPKFALKAGYAFAAAPDWFLSRSQYTIVGLSPLILISIVSILFATIVSSSIVPYLVFIATFNAAGALGDMVVVAWVLRQPDTILVKDEGDRFSSFAPDNE